MPTPLVSPAARFEVLQRRAAQLVEDFNQLAESAYRALPTTEQADQVVLGLLVDLERVCESRARAVAWLH